MTESKTTTEIPLESWKAIERLVPAFAAARKYADFCPPYPPQATMADFIADGHFERHIRRMRAIYQSRRALLVRLLERHLGSVGSQTGRRAIRGGGAGVAIRSRLFSRGSPVRINWRKPCTSF